jgi:hypothetical protein
MWETGQTRARRLLCGLSGTELKTNQNVKCKANHPPLPHQQNKTPQLYYWFPNNAVMLDLS